MTTPLLLNPVRTLDVQRAEFSRRRFLAMPLAGTIAWSVIGVASLVLKPWPLAITLFAATGSIAYLGMAISRLTGENFLDKSRPKNAFDALFMMTVGMSVLVYAIAIPFFRIEPSSLPLSVGILTGLMWLPLSWVIQHWIGIFHAVVRTGLLVGVWYGFPQHRYLAASLVIVAIYGVTIVVLERRWRAVRLPPSASVS